MSNSQPDDRLQQQLIERFLITYNQIDQHVRNENTSGKSFMVCVRYVLKERRQASSLIDELSQLNDLRNHLVHGQKTLRFRTAVPTLACIARIEKIRDMLIKPGTAFSKFGCKVETLNHNNSLSETFKVLHKLQISQFPIYEGSNFIGVITERALARWIAEHVSNNISLIDLDDTFVNEVICYSEADKNSEFVKKNTPIWRLTKQFQDNPLLEALLITQNGKKSEALLGIVSRWDISELTSN